MKTVVEIMFVAFLLIMIMVISLVVITYSLQRQIENGNFPCSYYRNYQEKNNGLPFSMNTTKIYKKIIGCNLE